MIPVILIAFLAVGVVGIFAFEICRTAAVRDQLRAATEAAALAGSTTLAGSSSLDPSTSQNNALTAAMKIFSKNDIFGTQLTRVENDFSASPKDGHVKVKITFIDPKTHRPVSVGDPKGKVMQVETKFGMRPLFADLVGATAVSLPVEATAQGGVGDLDIVLCFDISGSMDDQTKVTDVRRRWDPAEGKVKYDIVFNGTMLERHQAEWPQQLNVNSALRGATNTGSPPGNFPPGVGTVNGTTDAVVNLDEHDVFSGFSQDGFDFPTVGALVEAERGNLENAGVFTASKADTGLNGAVTPRPGYQAAYLKFAHQHTHPIAEARAAASDFFNLMNKNSNAHFGLVAFDDGFGADATSKEPGSNISPSYPPGGQGQFPRPTITIQKPEENTNFNEVTNATGGLVALGGTNIGGATNKAIDMFTESNSRANAKKIIIVFTDGDPTTGGPLSGDPRVNCQLAARKAKTKGIAIYTVGLALDPNLIPTQKQVLGDDTATGMAKLAGNGGRYFPVTSSQNIRGAFASIARQLSQLVD